MAVGVASDPGTFVVDLICDVCRSEGFTVEKNVQTGESDPLLVHVLAYRKKGKKLQRIAFGCGDSHRQVNAREIEGFVTRIKNLGVTNGIYVSPKGFTGDAEYAARKLGVELWDAARLKQRLERITASEKREVPGTLPVERALPEKILASTLENRKVLKLASLPKLEFRPYYFADFETQSGRGKSSRGVLILDGVDGKVCDAGQYEGHLNGLPATGLFLECLEIQPSTGSMPKLPPELEMNNTVTVAPVGVTEDSIRSLVTETLESEAGISSEEATVTAVNLLHVPIVTVELTAGERKYRKIVQAATGRIIWDETLKCSLCDQASKAVCEVCGDTVCVDHARICSSCSKHLCTECVVVKGVLNKSALCPWCERGA